MGNDDILNREKWVLIWCEYEAWGLWDKKNRACHFNNLPVSDEIRTMLAGWQAWFEHSDFSETTRWFDYKAHKAFGLFIARLVKRELPHWTVMFRGEITEGDDWRPGGPDHPYDIEILSDPDRKVAP